MKDWSLFCGCVLTMHQLLACSVPRRSHYPLSCAFGTALAFLNAVSVGFNICPPAFQ
jgi:hypothetical protein